jgi:small subunit ribosomal protein S1
MNGTTDRKDKGNGSASFEALLEQSLAPRRGASIGEKIEARIVSIGKEQVYLDLGTREDGILPRVEVEEDGKLTVEKGDTITVLAVQRRDGAVLCARRVGAAGVSERSGDQEMALATLAEAFEAEMPVEGTVKEVIKGGFTVTVMGQRAFCPISQIDSAYCEHPEEHVGHTYPFLLVELDGRGRNIVVSRRKLLDHEAEERAEKAWEELVEGAVVDGVITNVRSYGAFVDIGGVEGLLHVSEISHERIEDPVDVLQKGQRVKVAIKSIDTAQKRVALSLRMLEEDPWLEAVRVIAEGATLEGEVVRLAPFGAFVEVRKGVEGLVHISQMGGGKRLHTPREAVDVGQKVVVKVLGVDAANRRISLSMDEAATEQAEAEDLERRREYQATAKPGRSLGTLGDILSKHLKK